MTVKRERGRVRRAMKLGWVTGYRTFVLTLRTPRCTGRMMGLSKRPWPMRTRRYAPAEKVVKANLRRSSGATRSAPTCRSTRRRSIACSSRPRLRCSEMSAKKWHPRRRAWRPVSAKRCGLPSSDTAQSRIEWRLRCARRPTRRTVLVGGRIWRDAPADTAAAAVEPPQLARSGRGPTVRLRR